MKFYSKLFSLALCSIFSVHSFSQDFEWAQNIGSSSDDNGESIAADAAGNIYIVGEFQGTTDFDPGAGVTNLTSNGIHDIFIQKLDANGNFIWAKSFGGTTGSDYGVSLAVDLNGDIYITGRFWGTVDFDPGIGTADISSNGSFDIFIQKLNADGDFLWVKSLGSSDADWGASVTTDASGNVYATGIFSGTVDFDPGAGITNLTSNGGYEVFIEKLDPNGTFLWARSMGGPFNDFGFSINVDDTGNIHTLGTFAGTVDFDPGAGVANLNGPGNGDVFIQKLNSDGNFIWAKMFGGSDPDYGTSVTTDANDNVYLTGRFQGNTDFNPGPGTSYLTSSGSFDIFILKLNSSGNFAWAKKIGGSASDNSKTIISSPDGSLYLTGYFSGSVDFDPGAGTNSLGSSGNFDIFILKLDTNGNFIWAKKMGGSSSDGGYSICVDNSNNIYTTGFFEGNVDFDPGASSTVLSSNGLRDIFVQKISQCSVNSGTDIQSSCEPFLWIDGMTYSTNNNTASHTLTNIAGCDSIITLDLTVTTINSTVTSTSNSITAGFSGAIYQWLDCDNSFTELSGETNQTFNATLNGEFAVEVSQNGCVDTSDCVQIVGLSLNESALESLVKVHPNPTNGNLTINFNSDQGEVIINVYSLSGKLLKTYQSANQSNMEIEMKQSKGVYFLEFINSKNGIIGFEKVIFN